MFQLWEPFSLPETADFIDEYKHLDKIVGGRWNGMALEHTDSGKLAGDVAFKISDPEFTQGEIGVNISPDFQRRGLAREALQQLMNYMFEELKLHRIIAVMDSKNEAAAALVTQLGMRKEAHFIQNVWVKGRWGDEFLFAVLRDEWVSLKIKD